MRTDNDARTSAALHRLRSRAEHGWRWASTRSPRTRWGFLGAAAVVVIASGYYITTLPEATSSVWLFDGQSLADDDAHRVIAALEAAQIEVTGNGRGQLAVPKTRRSEAAAVLDAKRLGPRDLRGIREKYDQTASPWQSPAERASREEARRVETLEVLIAQVTGVASADVTINRAKPRSHGPNVERVGVLVLLHRRDDEPIGPQAIQNIKAVVKAEVPDLPEDSLTVLDDSNGQVYLSAGNPGAGAESMAHAREEQLRGKIQKQLNWIDGVRVFVTLEAPPIPAPVLPPPATAPRAMVVVNAPAEVADESNSSSPPAPVAAVAVPKAQILVQVPISHYLRGLRNLMHREPSLEELRGYAARTEDQVRSTILYTVPKSEVAGLQIDRIDDAGNAPPVAVAVATVGEKFRVPNWVAPVAGGVAVALAFALIAATRWLTSRRPSTPEFHVPRRAAFAVGDTAGPAERVRDLVRLDPEAAAGVLQRWIGQGGHVS